MKQNNYKTFSVNHPINAIGALMLLFILCNSCSNDKENNTIYIANDQWNLTGNLEPEFVYIDQLEVSRIGIADTNLIIVDKHKEKPFHIYGLSNLKHLGSFGVRGEGPYEFLNPTYTNQFQIKNGKNIITVGDRRKYKMMQINLTEALNNDQSEPYNIVSLPVEVGRYYNEVFMTASNNFVGNAFGINGHYFNYQVRSNKIEWSEFTPLLKDIPVTRDEMGYLFQSHSAPHPNREMFASAFSYFKKIEIVGFDGKVKKVFEFEGQPSIENLKPNPRGGLPEGILSQFWYIYATENYIYAPYDGRKSSETDGSNKKLYVVDWDGNAVALFDLNSENFGEFVVDEKSWKMYAENWGDNQEEYPLVSFDLSILANEQTK